MTLAKQSLPEKFTTHEFGVLSQKLDVAIKSKVEDPNSSINLSRFGLQGPDSLRRFLLTPAGETMTEELVTEKEQQQAIEKMHLDQIQEHIRMEQIRRAFFHFLLAEEDAEAQKAQNELIAMQQEKTLTNEKKAQEKAAPPQPNKATQEAIKNYDSAIKQLENDRDALEERSKKLKQERKLINNKYDAMEKSLDDAPKFEKKSENDIEAEIEKLRRKADKIADDMVNPKLKLTDEQVYAKGHELNAIEAKIANLNDIIATKKADGKQFVDAEGNPSSMKGAAFVIPKNQKIVKDDAGNYYLIKNGKPLKDLKEGERNEAREAFKREKKDIQVVRDVVKDTKKEALDHNTTSIAKNKAEKISVQNQINLMQSARAQLKQTLEHSPTDPTLPLKPPNSSITGKVPLPQMQATTLSSKTGSAPMLAAKIAMAAQFVQTVTAKQQAGKKSGKGYFLDQFFNDVDEIKDPDVKEHAKKFTDKLMTALDLKEMLSKTPVPETTMNAFIKHMAKFEDAYKDNVTPEQGPIEQQQLEPDTISPSATNT
ncbi:coiled coil protein [Legionella steigerwaltii]|uniref:Coiled coil protein n=1 Tax=Legionella steigerwaltii TaxID=460 RepID=A0A378L6C4_9GAMM|nr:hypothetical protein [Legionella steigerwaltii]KTD75421.1 coiled coil protein [Legionella steigerwaltii]STY22625.1 coiled coil protein [Legionella steigerwaltii]